MVYNGYADASKVPPAARGWLCHNVDVAPSEEQYTPKPWQKPHVENQNRHGQRLPAAGLAAFLGSRRPRDG